MARLRPNVHAMVFRWDVLKVKVKGQWSRDTGTFVMARKLLLLVGKWLDCDQTCTRWYPGERASRVCSRWRSRARDLYDCKNIASSSTLMAASWPNSVFLSPSLPFVQSIFFRFPIPKWLWVHSVSSAIAHNSHTCSETVCQTVCYTLRSHILSLHALTLWSIIRAYTLLPD